LVQTIEAGRTKVGDPVFAKTTIKWQGQQCDLKPGAILEGRIVAIHGRTKTAKISQIALLFESGQCSGRNLKPFPLTLAALLAADPERDANMYEYQPLSDAVGIGIGGGGSTGRGNSRSVTASATTIYNSPSRYKGPTAVMPGQVVGIKGVNLEVGSGPEGSSVVFTSGRNLRLESGFQLVLVPGIVPAATAADSPAEVTTASVPVTVKNSDEAMLTEDEIETCLPPQCSVALTPDHTNASASLAHASYSLKDLGYAPVRADYALYSFDYGSAISYLGPNELLFTFNPHVLIKRGGDEATFAKLRTIRAVLIDVQRGKVTKTVDWKVPDSRQYLWPISRNRVLVHVGRELRVYGDGLKLEQRLSIDGPLAFLRPSPSSAYFAVGVVEERHAQATHWQLEEAEGREPEEDVEVKVLDANLRALATVVRSSRAAPPVLSDTGEILILRASKNRWEFVEETWEGQRRLIARVDSRCMPQATSLPPDLLFVVGCDRQAMGKWYRVLQPDGKPVLKGWSPSVELEHVAGGVAAANAFTVGFSEATKAMGADSAFHASDLESEHIAVYRAANGARLFTLTVPSPEPTVQTFALSPDANQLAVLQGDQIAFYKIPLADGR
jgi:hypothetical protein